MKKLYFLFIALLFIFSAEAKIDTTIAKYNFNNLATGGLKGKDAWATTLSGTSTDVQVKAGHSHDGSNAIHFPKGGKNVHAMINRPLDKGFPNFSYADSGTYFLYFDFNVEYWNSQIGLAYDIDKNGKITKSGNSEKGFRFEPGGSGAGKSNLYTFTQSKSNSQIQLALKWYRFEIKLEPYANNGSGLISIRFRDLNSTTWTDLFKNIDAGFNHTATDARNPANWDQMYFHFTGSGSGLDNLEFWKLAGPPAPNEVPTNILLSGDSVFEAQPIQTLIGTLSSVDANPRDVHQYSLVSGTGSTDNTEFTISNNKLYSAVIFNRRLAATKSIRIKTEDQDGASFEKIFTIRVLEVNESPTDILLSNDSIKEELPEGTFVGKLSAIDPEPTDNHTYSLVQGAGNIDNNIFTISNDSLYCNIVLDYETNRFRYIRIQAEDQMGNTFAKAFTIYVTYNAGNDPGDPGDPGDTTSIYKLSKNQLQVYPNPSQEQLWVELEKGGTIKTAKLYTLSGKLVFSKQLNETKAKLDVSNLENGQYILILEDMQARKFMSKSIQVLR